MGDLYVSVEHLFLSMLNSTEEKLRNCLLTLTLQGNPSCSLKKCKRKSKGGQ